MRLPLPNKANLISAMLLLDDKAYKSLPENSKVLYLLQWLQNLPKVIKETERVSVSVCII